MYNFNTYVCCGCGHLKLEGWMCQSCPEDEDSEDDEEGEGEYFDVQEHLYK